MSREALTSSTSPGRATSRRAALGLLGFVFVLALVGFDASGARAAPARPSFGLESQGVAGSQRYLVLHARPGQSLTRQIRVVNVGGRAGSVLLYAVDATTGQTTGAVYQGAEVPRRDVGAWTALGRHSLRLAPGEARLITVRVRVPRSAAPARTSGASSPRTRRSAGVARSGADGAASASASATSPSAPCRSSSRGPGLRGWL